MVERSLKTSFLHANQALKKVITFTQSEAKYVPLLVTVPRLTKKQSTMKVSTRPKFKKCWESKKFKKRRLPKKFKNKKKLRKTLLYLNPKNLKPTQ
jgi:hypothetical protein